MALKDLSTAQMVGISEAMLDEGRLRPLLAKYETIQPQLKKLAVLREHLLGAALDPGPGRELAVIKAREAEVDGIHDRKITGLANLLETLEGLADTELQREALRDARSHLLGEGGLSIVRATYLAESGNASMVKKRLTEDDLCVLKGVQLPLGMGTLADHLEQYYAAARELGELESRRSALESAPKGPGKADMVTRRNQWIQLVNAILGNLESEDVPPEELKRIQAVVDISRKPTVPTAPAEAPVETPK